MDPSLLPALAAFARVAAAGSFTRAAALMGVSPSAPSQSVRMLEKKLDVRLLHRTTRSVSATEEGRRLGVPQRKVRQFDGWQGIDVDGLRLAFTPTRHFSGRGIGDGNRTLWGSRAIADGERRRFFSGDSGYFDGFAEIGRRFGPFDPTLMETGAYDAHWSYVHMHPAQTVQAHRDLRGRGLLPIHNGTSGLAMHPGHDPFDAMLRIAEARGVAAATAVMGERIDLDAPHAGERWWRDVVAARAGPRRLRGGDVRRRNDGKRRRLWQHRRVDGGTRMRNLDFSSWQGLLISLFGLIFITLLGVGIRLVMMQTLQQKRERENRQINERLRTLIAAYKTLGGSFTGRLHVDPTHLRELKSAGDADAVSGSDRARRMRDAVEAALSDIILLGTEEQVKLAATAAAELAAGRPVETHELVVSLRDFVRKALDLDPIPEDVAIPKQGPTRPGSGGAKGKGDAGKDDAKGGGKGAGGGGGGMGGMMGGMGAGAGMGMGVGHHLGSDDGHDSQ